MATRLDDNSEGTISLTAAIFCIALACVGCILVLGRSTAQADTLDTSIYISICGNGLVDNGELCDGGSGQNSGGYGSTTAQRICTVDCQHFGPYCGDGILQVRFGEQCDAGAANGGGGLCSTYCQSLPSVPPGIPPKIVGSTPVVPGVPPGVIPAELKTQVILRGKAFPNTDVNILLDGKPFGVVRADTNADFLYNTTSVAPGTETLSFWAKDSNGVASLTTSIIFEVVQSAITSVNNIFIPPTLSVSDAKIAPGGLLTIFGQSAPTAQVITSLDSDSSNALSSAVDQAGKWALQLDTASITTGFHSAKASFIISSSSKSGFGKSVSFFVGNQLPAGGASPDLNHDGKVNLVDFSIFLLSWNTHNALTDFNTDGNVNLADFSIMLFDWTG